MPDDTSDADLRAILDATKTIAMVGASTNPVKPSFFVATYFNSRGRRIIPVNPGLAGQTLFGEPIVASLADIPDGTQVDMVDIFRRSEAVPDIVSAAIAHLLPGLKTIWMQFGVRNEAAADEARAAGLSVVQDRCPKVEHMRLWGGLNPAGLKTGVISSRLPRLG